MTDKSLSESPQGAADKATADKRSASTSHAEPATIPGIGPSAVVAAVKAAQAATESLSAPDELVGSHPSAK